MTKQFKFIFSMNILTIFLGLFAISSSKSYAIESIKDERFLSNVASLGTIFGGLRCFWSVLLDKYSFKYIYGTMILIQIVIAFTLPFVLEMPDSSLKNFLYGACVCILFNTEGGHFVLTPTIYVKLFGV